MASSENTLSLPVGELPESIESRWTHFRELKWKVIRDAILAIAAPLASTVTIRVASSKRESS